MAVTPARALVTALLLVACGSRTERNVADSVNVPVIDAPVIDVPVVDVPVVDVPVIDVPVVDAPVVDAPVVDAPVVDVPVVDVISDRPVVDGPIARCGNGVREAAEECDDGPRNALIPAFALSQPGRPEVAVAPLARRSSAAAFYDYRSASAHTGFEAPSVASVFLYVDVTDNDLALFFIAGRDGDLGIAPAQPEADIEELFQGLPTAAEIAVSDDNDELSRLSPTDARGRWSFDDNSDGGVLRRLPWNESWRITMQGTWRAGVTSIRYVGGDARFTALALNNAVVLQHRSGRSTCRPDCRIPRCGDGFVDGGERCDDGNTRPADGCASDCQRFE